MLCKLGGIQRLAEVQQMHVRVIEPGADKTPAQIRAYGVIIRESADHRIGTDRQKYTVLNQKGLPESFLSGVDLPVVPDCSHAVASSP